MQNTRDEIDSTDVGQGIADIGELAFLRDGIEHLRCNKVRNSTQGHNELEGVIGEQ